MDDLDLPIAGSVETNITRIYNNYILVLKLWDQLRIFKMTNHSLFNHFILLKVTFFHLLNYHVFLSFSLLLLLMLF